MNFTEFLGSAVFEHPDYLSDVITWHSHVPFAFWCVDAVQPRIFVELGTYKGDSYCAFCQAVHKLGLSTACYAVDTWKGDEHAGSYGEEVYETLQHYHDTHYGAFSRLVRSTFDEAVGYFDDGSIDLLHLDGLRTYASVKHDFETWLPKLSGRAVVLFHDINVRERDFGAGRLWEEFCERYPHFAFLHGHGLGVLAVGQQLQPSIERLCSLSCEETEQVRSIFTRLGHTVSVTSERGALAWRTTHLDSIFKARDRALNHHQATLYEHSSTLAHQEIILAERDQTLRNDDLAIQRSTLRDKDRLIIADEAERPTLRAQVSRWLSRQRNVWAPPTSPQGKMLGRMIGAAYILHDEGIISLVRRGVYFGLYKMRPQYRQAMDWLHTSGLFNARYYLSTYPDVAAQGMDPATHYIRFGWQEGRKPHPLFDGAWYLAHNPDVAQASVNPLWHYTTVGWQEGRKPHPLFDGAWYLAHNPDVAQAGVNPLWHYTTVGWQEGRKPHPLFDGAWYLAHNPDVAQAGVNPLEHYITVGWQEGRKPHPLFDNAFYLAHNPDVAQAGVNPLEHYITVGWQEGRNPHPLFDTQFYLSFYPDVARARQNPLQHYITHGWKVGRDPHPLFDANFYVESNPDVRTQNINPAIHYATVIKQQSALDHQNTPLQPYLRPRVLSLPRKTHVTIGTVTYNNSSDEYAQYQQSLLLATREILDIHPFSLLYIDNGVESHLSSLDSQFIQLPSRGNIGFGTAHNDMLAYAFQKQNADIYICANPDGVFHRFCLRNLIEMHTQFPKALIEARQFPEEHPKYYHPTKFDTHWASGCCLLIPRKLYQTIGGYDPHFFLYMEDVDYAWRARLAGFQVKICPTAIFGHHVLGRQASTSTKRYFLESGRYLGWKWGNYVFQQSCESDLIKDKYYEGQSNLPSFSSELKMAITSQEQEEICTFDQMFSFSPTRW